MVCHPYLIDPVNQVKIYNGMGYFKDSYSIPHLIEIREEHWKIFDNHLLPYLQKYAIQTGSYYFGYQTYDSDFDYFMSLEDFNRIKRLAKQVGNVITQSHYDSSNVYIWTFTFFGMKIEVQIIKDNYFKVKCLTNEYIKNVNGLAEFLYSKPKEERKIFWEQSMLINSRWFSFFV